MNKITATLSTAVLAIGIAVVPASSASAADYTHIGQIQSYDCSSSIALTCTVKLYTASGALVTTKPNKNNTITRCALWGVPEGSRVGQYQYLYQLMATGAPIAVEWSSTPSKVRRVVCVAQPGQRWP